MQPPPPLHVFSAYMPFVQIVPQGVPARRGEYMHSPPLSQPVGCAHPSPSRLHFEAQQFPPSPATPQMSEAHWLLAPQGEPGDFRLPPVLLPPVVPFPPPLVVLPAPVPLLELFDDPSQATIAIMIPNRAHVFTASSARRRSTPRGRSAEGSSNDSPPRYWTTSEACTLAPGVWDRKVLGSWCRLLFSSERSRARGPELMLLAGHSSAGHSSAG